MEPFELALSQVNFEEKDLSSTQPLHSFSNLVSYDSDFQDGNSGSPIIAKRVSKAGEVFPINQDKLFSNTYNAVRNLSQFIIYWKRDEYKVFSWLSRSHFLSICRSDITQSQKIEFVDIYNFQLSQIHSSQSV